MMLSRAICGVTETTYFFIESEGERERISAVSKGEKERVVSG